MRLLPFRGNTEDRFMAGFDEHFGSGRFRHWPDEQFADMLGSRFDFETMDGLASVFAMVGEAVSRRIGMRASRRQVLAGYHLWHGRVVEMGSGDGKTLAVALAALVGVLSGRSVKVATSNDYLAVRDRDFIEPVCRLFGIKLGAVVGDMDSLGRASAYGCHLVYGTLREFGFDYLRDRLVSARGDVVQGKADWLILDEVDHALLDEAAIPLVIGGDPVLDLWSRSGVAAAVEDMVAEQFRLADAIAVRLEESGFGLGSEGKLLIARALAANPWCEAVLSFGTSHPSLWRGAMALLDPHGTGHPVDEVVEDLYCPVARGGGSFSLLDSGVEFLESRLGGLVSGDGFSDVPAPVLNRIYQLLRAHLLLRRDVDYIVLDGLVVLVDRSTGRSRPDTRFQDGLHEAIEVKEGLAITLEHRVLAEIGVPGLVGTYPVVSGISATAVSEQDEFLSLYGLEVVSVGSEPVLRASRGSRIYPNLGDHIDAVLDEVQGFFITGQPVLVACRTVQGCRRIADALERLRVPHGVVEAGNADGEVGVIRGAGLEWAVTVATNMAGRGTDIVLEEGLNRSVLRNFVDLASMVVGLGCRLYLEVRCGNVQEAFLLAETLAQSVGSDLSFEHVGDATLRLYRRGCDVSVLDAGPVVDFSLGLRLVNVEFNDSPRVAVQLDGRSGRQGAFGSTVGIFSSSDVALSGLDFGPIGSDRLGRPCWSGSSVDLVLKKRREEVRLRSARERGLVVGYGSVMDRYLMEYYRTREAVLDWDEEDSSAWMDRAVLGLCESVVCDHFPGYTVEDYGVRFAALCRDLDDRFGLDCSELRGVDLGVVVYELKSLFDGRFEGFARRLGVGCYVGLTRLLVLSVGDAFCEDLRSVLKGRAVISRLVAHDSRTALAEYVVGAGLEWDGFLTAWRSEVVCRLLRFQLSDLDGAVDASSFRLSGLLA